MFSLRRQYPPVSLQQLQLLADTNRLDTSKPIDLTALMNTGLIFVNPDLKHYGVQLTDEVCNFVIHVQNLFIVNTKL